MEQKKPTNTNEHLANERTFLAWIRTSIGIMAFGFVVVKFSLFVKQLTLILGKPQIIHQKGYSAIMGIMLVAVGAVSSIMAYLRYKKVAKQIDTNEFKNSTVLITILISFIFLMSILLITYLVESI